MIYFSNIQTKRAADVPSLLYLSFESLRYGAGHDAAGRHYSAHHTDHEAHGDDEAVAARGGEQGRGYGAITDLRGEGGYSPVGNRNTNGNSVNNPCAEIWRHLKC